MQGSRPADVHTIPYANVARRSRWHHDGVDFAVGAVPVIAAEVSSVRCRLVEVGLVGLRLALQLEHHHGAVDRRMTSGRRDSSGSSYSRMVVYSSASSSTSTIRPGSLGSTRPKRRLGGRRTSEELLERDADDLRLLFGESREVALPPVSRPPRIATMLFHGPPFHASSPDRQPWMSRSYGPARSESPRAWWWGFSSRAGCDAERRRACDR